MRNLWASFDFLVHFLIIFFIVQSFKNEISSKILDTQKYNIVRHWFSSKNWIFGFLRFFLRKFLLTVLHIFHRKYTPNFQKIDFSIYPNILYICDQNFMLVPTIKLLEFSDKNWETYERLLIFWSIFWLFFLLVQSFKNEISSKILDTQKYNIVRHWFSSKNWIFSIFFKKVSIDGFTHYLWKILLIFLFQSFKNEISSKILDTQKYNIVRHWFSSKNWIFSIFFKKVSIDGFTHFWSKIHPKFSKKSTFPYTPIYYIFVIRILCSFQQSNY